MTSTKERLYELAAEYVEYSEELLACDPSQSEDALEEFISIQEWGEALHAKARKYGFSWEQVENESDELRN